MNSKYTIALLIILGLVIWGNTLRNTLLWDDDDNITNNVYIKDFQHLPKLFTQNQIAGAGFISNQYRPLLLLSYSIEYHLIGLNPVFYHLTNIIIHILNSILVFFFIKILLKKGEFKFLRAQRRAPHVGAVAHVKISDEPFKYFIPTITSILFLIHPVQTESVAYIAGRTDLLSTTFILSGLLVYLSDWPKLIRVTLIALIYCAALLSKESSIILPALIFLLYILKRKYHWDQIIIQFPLLVLGVGYATLRLTTFNFQNTLNFYTSENIFTQSVLIRVYTFLSTLPQYLLLLLFPVHLHPERTTPVITSFLSIYSLLGFFICVLSALGVIYFWKKNPLTVFGIIWFFITIFLSTNILIPVNALITEHWLYTPAIGIFLIIGLILNNIFTRNKIVIVLFLIVSLLFSLRTMLQNTIWYDQISLYEYILKYNPQSARVHNNLGMAYDKKGLSQKAIIEYKKAIKLNDTYPQTHHNLANALSEQGFDNEAIVQYQKALQIDPNFLFSYKPLIKLLEKQKRTKEAEELKNRVQYKKIL